MKYEKSKDSEGEIVDFNIREPQRILPKRAKHKKRRMETKHGN